MTHTVDGELGCRQGHGNSGLGVPVEAAPAEVAGRAACSQYESVWEVPEPYVYGTGGGVSWWLVGALLLMCVSLRVQAWAD